MSSPSSALRSSYNAVVSASATATAATTVRRLSSLATNTPTNPAPALAPALAPISSSTTAPLPPTTPARPLDSILHAAPIAPASRPDPPPAPIWFNSATARFDGPPSPSPNDQDQERKVKLGKSELAPPSPKGFSSSPAQRNPKMTCRRITNFYLSPPALRILQERLPTLLQSPLPQEILSANISLHLFPSTHPYLPVVSGRVAYIAALWTSPIAWNRVPIFGNVGLDILSERMTSQPLHFSPRRAGACGEQLVVKWRTASSSSSSSSGGGASGRARASSSDRPSLAEQGERRLDENLRGDVSSRETNGNAKGGGKEPFTGLFIFEFDRQGKIISHTIEHVDEHGEWEKGVGAKVVGLTDWLLGGIKRGPAPAGGAALPLFQATTTTLEAGKKR